MLPESSDLGEFKICRSLININRLQQIASISGFGIGSVLTTIYPSVLKRCLDGVKGYLFRPSTYLFEPIVLL